MKTDESTVKGFKEFMTRHQAFEAQNGPIEHNIEQFLDISRLGMKKMNESIQDFFNRGNTDPGNLTEEEAGFMPPFIVEVTKYLRHFTEFESAYTTYCGYISKYYELQQKILQSVNEENISKEAWHMVFLQKEYLDDLEGMLKEINRSFISISGMFKKLWQQYMAAGYSAE